MTAEHTPGPWSITSDDGGDLYITAPDVTDLESPWNIAIAVGACGYRDDPRTGCTAANARLIAAAPEMYEALKPLAECEIIETDAGLADSDSARYFITMGEIRAARAALRKARGEA